MKGKLICLDCPHCKASLEVDDGIDTFYCLYCGGRVVLADMSDSAYRAKVRIKELKHQETMKDKENEQERYRLNMEKDKNKHSTVLFVGILIFCGLMILLPSITLEYSSIKHQKTIKALQEVEFEIQECIKVEEYDMALIKCNQLYCDNYSWDDKNTWDLKRENYIRLITAQKRKAENNIPVDKPYQISPPFASSTIKELNYKDAILQFENAGFYNIEKEELDDVKLGLLVKEGEIESITIDGKPEFSTEDEFYDNAIVRITYHVKKE